MYHSMEIPNAPTRKQSSRNSWRIPLGTADEVSEVSPAQLLAHVEGASYEQITLHATYCVQSGIEGVGVETEEKKDTMALKAALFHQNYWWRLLYLLMTIVNLLLATFEKSSSRDATEPSWIEVIDFVCLSVFTFDVVLLYRYARMDFAKSNWIKMRIFVLLILFINTTSICVNPDAHHIARIFRPFLLLERFRFVRDISASMAASAPKILNVLVLLVFHVVFFGVMGFLLFRGVTGKSGGGVCNFFDYDPLQDDDSIIPPYCSTFSKNCRDYFNTIGGSMLQLFILLTTANYPDIMMPVYECNRGSVIFFVLYELIGLYFLMSLILAVVYTHFSEKSSGKFGRSYKKQLVSYNHAFHLLVQAKGKRQRAGSVTGGLRPSSTENMVELSEWMAMMSKLSPHVPEEVSHAVFLTESEKNENKLGITRKQFIALCPFTQLSVRKKPHVPGRNTPGGVEDDMTHTGKLAFLNRLVPVVRSQIWMRSFDVLVILNTIILLMILQQGKAKGLGAALEIVSDVLLYIFAAELLTTILALKFRPYWNESWINKVDFTCILAGLIVHIGSHFALDKADSTFKAANSNAIKIIGMTFLFLRILRLVRIMRVMSEFQTVVYVVVRVLPPLVRYFAVLMVIYYIYAVIGMELYSGRLNVGAFNKTDDKLLLFLNSSYVVNQYEHNNFDTFWNAMVVLWEQMVVNNWPIVLEGCAYSHVGWAWSLVFFISFYLVTVITVMNVLIAYLLDAYQNQVELKKEAEGNENSQGGGPLAWNVNLNRVAAENDLDISGLRIRHQMSTEAMLLYIHVETLKQEASFVDEDDTLEDAILNPGHKYSQSIL